MKYFKYFIEPEIVVEHCISFLEDIDHKNGGNWNGKKTTITDIKYQIEDSPSIVACLQDIIKHKKHKKYKEALEKAMEVLGEYFVTLDRDVQIKVLKYVNQ